MKSLIDLLNEHLKDFPSNKLFEIKETEEKKYDNLGIFITNDKKSAWFINKLVFDNENFYDINCNLFISQCRARHSVISLFLGLSIGKFCDSFSNLTTALNDSNIEFLNYNEPYILYWLWLIISVNHDYGYYSKYLTKKISLDELKLKYNIFNDEEIIVENLHNECKDKIEKITILKCFESKYPNVLKNSYEQIKNYYAYSQVFHELNGNKDKEKNDHGILGGVLLFDRGIKKILKRFINAKPKYSLHSMDKEVYTNNYILYYKACCLTICQHNIYKSNNSNTDKLYGKELKHLHHDKEYSIGIDTPLLFLLSLVDTIECIKIFSKKENDDNYLQTMTVLTKIKMEVKKEKIILDLTELKEEIEKKENKSLMDKYENYIKGLCNLSQWTDVFVEKNDEIIIIKMKEKNEFYSST